MSVKTRSSKVATDGNLIASQVFSKVFQAYLECSDKVQAAIRDMSQIVNDPNADPDESDAALATIAEALFPTRDNGTLGVDSESLDKNAPTEMDAQEETFADRLNSLLRVKGMTQSDLAAAIRVGQPAVSMMLSRQCRPQRRTVTSIAKALDVPPREIWPTFDED